MKAAKLLAWLNDPQINGDHEVQRWDTKTERWVELGPEDIRIQIVLQPTLETPRPMPAPPADAPRRRRGRPRKGS